MPTCRSCDAEIIWAMTPAGRLIPLDLGLYDNGNIELRDGIAHVVTDPGDRPRRRSHFASCPDAVQHRQRHPAAHRPVRLGLEDQ